MSKMVTGLLLVIVGGGVIGITMEITGIHPFIGLGACFMYGLIVVPVLAKALHSED